ncbi:hypothetical protein CEK60_00510 [Halomonas sp. N3-2A]|nr:hypothetical protein CEK60_00510 [Halomonas sp. N3-2A]
MMIRPSALKADSFSFSQKMLIKTPKGMDERFSQLNNTGEEGFPLNYPTGPPRLYRRLHILRGWDYEFVFKKISY